MTKITIFLFVAICVLYSNAGITYNLSNKAAEYRDFLKKSIDGTPTGEQSSFFFKPYIV